MSPTDMTPCSNSSVNQTLQPFDFKGVEVRVIIGQDNEPRWIATDVAKVLGYRDAANLARNLRDRHKGTHSVSTPGGVQKLAVITEAGLYQAVMRSNKPEAEQFQDWVTDEVLPAIRKHGGYLTEQKIEEALTNPDMIIQLATQLKAERAQRAALEAEAAANEPKVLFADAVSVSDTAILVRELATILKGNGIDIGQQRLYATLRHHGYLISREGTDYNTPTQKAMNLGLFKVKETAVTHSRGNVTISKTPKVTGKGQRYFVGRFLKGTLKAVA